MQERHFKHKKKLDNDSSFFCRNNLSRMVEMNHKRGTDIQKIMILFDTSSKYRYTLYSERQKFQMYLRENKI